MHFKRADYLKYYGDVEHSIKDYEKVIELCNEFTGREHPKNSRMRDSA